MTLAAEASAQLLASQLPQLRRYHGATMVVKYGGNAMTEPALQRAFAEDIVLLQHVGIRPVVVHGGGPQIESLLQRLGKKGEFIQGMRVTDDETMQVVQWVLAGEVQQDLVGLIGQCGGRAVGLTGRDACMVRAHRMKVQDPKDPAVQHDVGHVGEVESVDVTVLDTLLDDGFIPVVSPIGYGAKGERFNINADVVASQVAMALGAEKLLMLSNIPGVLDAQGQLIRSLTPARIDALCADGTISGGMIPKIAGALDAARSGVKAVHILDGRVAHGLLLEVLADQAMGTMISSQG